MRLFYLLATVVVSGGFLALGVMSYRTPTVGTTLMFVGGGFAYLMACLMGRNGKPKRRKDDEE